MGPAFININPRRMCEGYGSRSVSKCVCPLPRQLLHTRFIRWKQIRLFMVFLYGFCWKHLIQKFWQHLLTTTAFFIPWWALDQLKRQRLFHFRNTMYASAMAMKVFLAIEEAYLHLIWVTWQLVVCYFLPNTLWIKSEMMFLPAIKSLWNLLWHIGQFLLICCYLL